MGSFPGCIELSGRMALDNAVKMFHSPRLHERGQLAIVTANWGFALRKLLSKPGQL